MRRVDAVLVAIFVAAVAAGTAASRHRLAPPPRVAGGWLLAGDFHVHAFPGDGTLAPPQLRREAARRNLHVIALTNHNHMLQTRFRAPKSGADQLPLVLYGQEVTTATAHIVALDIRQTVAWRGGPGAAIDTIHARGGVAILAHPAPVSRLRPDFAALSRADGIEIANGRRSRVIDKAGGVSLYRSLRSQRPVAAIGVSDFHYAAPLGVQRTVLLVAQLDERGVLDAVRHGRTAVRFASEWVGDTTVIRAAREHQAALFDVPPAVLSLAAAAASVLAWLALLGLVLRS